MGLPTSGGHVQRERGRRPEESFGRFGYMAPIDLAIRQAMRSRCRYRMAAVLVAGNRVLAWSPNLRRNNPMIDFRHATFHAEEAVLRRARHTAGAVIYIARVNLAGSPLLARPCPRCQQALAIAGVTRAHYTTGATTVGTLVIAGSSLHQTPVPVP
ncbi:hypothetical protein [Streptomyces sp. NPDC047028]|uniref:hypothetical protein n=1 Tax=Streptomyces sp. NPDC047028 TaxID=3155793 RepID=UPI00340B7607